MKLLVSSLALLSLAACTQTVNTHRKDFSPAGRQGAWTDYDKAIMRGEKPQPPKEKKS